MTTGLIVGKFYPPHAGHHYLIDYALERVDELHVVVWHSKVESIPGEVRYDILKEMHPRARIWTQKCEIVPDYSSDDVWKEHLNLLYELGNPDKYDVVFTSEDYGEELAKRLNAEHHEVDIKRINVPVSGTKIREDPAGNWQHLSEPTRAYLTKRFVITGAESTGSTTLTKALAEHYGTVWVPEYGRFYTEGSGILNHEWTTDEFLHIIEGQHLAEDFLARKAGPVMFCDTDALSTAVWHERYTWKRSKEVEMYIRKNHYEHYFITDYLEVPFEDDGLRDGNLEIRQWMQERLLQKTMDYYPHSRINVMIGGPRMRVAHAIHTVDKYLNDGWYLNPPLGD
jgi:HTH-type transcriptional repressor of NAD biosynthesis genes